MNFDYTLLKFILLEMMFVIEIFDHHHCYHSPLYHIFPWLLFSVASSLWTKVSSSISESFSSPRFTRFPNSSKLPFVEHSLCLAYLGIAYKYIFIWVCWKKQWEPYRFSPWFSGTFLRWTRRDLPQWHEHNPFILYFGLVVCTFQLWHPMD